MRRRTVVIASGLTAACALGGCTATSAGTGPAGSGTAGPGTAGSVSVGSGPASSSPFVPISPPTRSGTQPVHARCPTGAPAVFADATGGDGAVRTVAAEADGLLTCRYRVARSGGAARAATDCGGAVLTVDIAPQAYVDFHRWVDEAVQNSTIPGQRRLAPQLVAGLYREADWVPGRLTLETAREGRWISVRLTCAGAAGTLALARSLARTALDR